MTRYLLIPTTLSIYASLAVTAWYHEVLLMTIPILASLLTTFILYEIIKNS